MFPIAGVLGSFRTRAAAVETRPFLDPLSYPLYGMIVAAALAELIAWRAIGFSMGRNSYAAAMAAWLLLLVIGLIARRYALPSVAGALESLGLFAVMGSMTWLGTIIAATAAGPFVDVALNHADQIIGFDWLALLRLYQRHPWMSSVSGLAYRSLQTQMFVVPVLLFASGRRARGWALTYAWAIASLLTVVIFPFFPAEGPYIRFGIARDALPGQIYEWYWQFGPIIDALRSGETRDVSRMMIGIVSFPSFHAAAAVILAWSILPLRLWRWPFIALNTVMLFSTVVRGAYYLIDVVAGVLLAAIAIGAALAFVSLLSERRCR